MPVIPEGGIDVSVPGSRRGRPRLTAMPPPTRAEVVGAVVRLAEMHPETDINMRDLASELKVSPKLLYRYVRGKDELLDLAAAALLESWVAPSPYLAWPDRLSAVVGGARDLIERFPALSRAVLLRNLDARDSPEVARVVEAIKGCFAEAGLSVPEIEQVFLAYEILVLGDLALSQALRENAVSRASLPDASVRSTAIATTLRLMITGLIALRVEDLQSPR